MRKHFIVIIEIYQTAFISVSIQHRGGNIGGRGAKITFNTLHKENISTLNSQYKNNEIFLSLIISMFAKTFQDYTVNLPKYLPPKFYNFTLQPS